MLNIIINLSGLILIGLIVWWFWLDHKGKALQAGARAITITVDSGIYEPALIHAKQGDHITLRFLRQDASPCAETVTFPELNVSAALPVDKPHDIELYLEKPGEFEFTCAMGMYRGKLVVE